MTAEDLITAGKAVTGIIITITNHIMRQTVMKILQKKFQKIMKIDISIRPAYSDGPYKYCREIYIMENNAELK